jgi:hypothetical protein
MKKKPSEIELVTDAWDRFERAASVVVKTPPQHRVKPKAKSKKSQSSPKRKQTKSQAKR